MRRIVRVITEPHQVGFQRPLTDFAKVQPEFTMHRFTHVLALLCVLLLSVACTNDDDGNESEESQTSAGTEEGENGEPQSASNSDDKCAKRIRTTRAKVVKRPSIKSA